MVTASGSLLARGYPTTSPRLARSGRGFSMPAPFVRSAGLPPKNRRDLTSGPLNSRLPQSSPDLWGVSADGGPARPCPGGVSSTIARGGDYSRPLKEPPPCRSLALSPTCPLHALVRFAVTSS